MSEQFYAEDGCDAWLAQSGLLPESGVYVDAGCAHPWRFSQTAFLRNRGWTGIAIDGDPAYAPEWEGVPNATFVNTVLSDKAWEHFLVEPTNALVSRVHAEGKGVPSFKLQQVLDVYGVTKVDFLALDLEGMEVEVLHAYLLPRSIEGLPNIIVSEFNSCHKGRDVQIFNQVAKMPYKLVHLTDSNAVFSLCWPRY